MLAVYPEFEANGWAKKNPLAMNDPLTCEAWVHAAGQDRSESTGPWYG